MTFLLQLIINVGLMLLGGVVLFFVFRHLPGPDGRDHYEDYIPQRKKDDSGSEEERP